MRFQMNWRRLFALLGLLAGVALFAACGSDETGDNNQGNQPGNGEELVGEDSSVVGGGCFEDDACEGKCMTGSDWPGGMCTLECDNDTDCPDLSYCIAIERGICLMDCYEDADCPSGYECDDKDREGHRGEAYVCVED